MSQNEPNDYRIPDESIRMFGRPLTEVLKSVKIDRSIMGTPSGYCFGCKAWPCICHGTPHPRPNLKVETVGEGTGLEPVPVRDKTTRAYGLAKSLAASHLVKVEKPEDFIALVDLIEKEL